MVPKEDIGMDREQAITDLKVTGYLLIGVGIFGMFGTFLFWDWDNLIESVSKVFFATGFIYFGYLVLRSKKYLARISIQSVRKKKTKEK